MSDVRMIQRFQPKSRRCIETDIVVPPDHDGNYVLYADHKVLIEAKDKEIAELKAEKARLKECVQFYANIDHYRPLCGKEPTGGWVEIMDIGMGTRARKLLAGDK